MNRDAILLTGSQVLENVGRDVAEAEVERTIQELVNKGARRLYRGDARGIDGLIDAKRLWSSQDEDGIALHVLTYCLDGTIRSERGGEVIGRWISERGIANIQDRRRLPLTRNTAMTADAAACERVVCTAFEASFSATKGTAHTYHTALQFGIPVYRVTFERDAGGVKVDRRETVPFAKTPFARKLSKDA